jgi:hypothetical protein
VGIVLDRMFLGSSMISNNLTGGNITGGIVADCAGSSIQPGAGIVRGLKITSNTNDPWFPNIGTHIVANVPEISVWTANGVILVDEHCKLLQPDAIEHKSAHP